MQNKLQIITAIGIQVILQSTITFFGVRQVIQPDWQKVLRFALHPLALLFYGTLTIPLWWGNRTVYQGMGDRYWAFGFVYTLIMNVTGTIIAYIVTRQIPTEREVIGLLLTLVAVIISIKA